MAKDWLTFTCIFGLSVYAIYAIHGQTCKAPVTGVLDRYLYGNSYAYFESAERQHCEKKCLAIGYCQSINFRKSDGFCEFVNNANQTLLAPAPGWEYIEKIDLIQRYGDPCGTTPCPDHHECIKLKSGDTACVITECGVPPTWHTASVQYFRKNNPVGRTVQYVCASGYRLSAGSSGELMCLANGNFAQIDFFCEQIVCGNPPGLENAMIAMVFPAVPGSTVEYECLYGSTMEDGRTTETLICQNNGTWPQITLSCSQQPAAVAAEAPSK